MIQAIKDLANAIMPSGRLIELVDIALVRGFLSQVSHHIFTAVTNFYDFSVFYYVLQPLMVNTLPQPFGDEIKGIAAVSGVPLGKKCK